MHPAVTTSCPRQGKTWHLDKEVILFYDGAPAHRNPAIPAANTEMEMLPAYSPFLNRVVQATGSLKAVVKRGISRPEIQARMDDRAEVRQN